MARHFTVTLTSGTNVGPYDIYYDQINSSNFATLYGTTNDADGLTLSQVQSGVVVTVPNSASTILLYNTNADFNTDCQTTTITYNIPGQVTPTPTATQVPTSTPTPTPSSTPVPTSSPTPVPTNEPTPSPTSTSVPPTPTSSSTPVPTFEPTPTPTDQPTPTPIPPTPTATVQNTGTCQFWQVDLQVIDQTQYGIAYTHPTSGATQTRFNALMSSVDPSDENNVVFGICSESQSGIYDFNSNQMVVAPPGITQLADGGVCTADNECTWTFSTPTPTPTIAINPTPTEVVCRTYDCVAEGGNDVMFEYIDCAGSSQSVMVLLGDSVEVCAREGTVTMLPNDGTIIPGQLCSGNPTATPSPTSTPTSTPMPTMGPQNTYYVTTQRLDLQDFCDVDYMITVPVTSSASGKSNLLGTTLYDNNGDPFQGNPSRYMVVDTVTGTTQTTFSPWTYISVDLDGQVTANGTYDCSSDSGGNEFSENIVPTATSSDVGESPTPTPESSD